MRFIDEISLGRLGIKEILSQVEPLSPYGSKAKKNVRPVKRIERLKLENEFITMEHLREYVLNYPDRIKKIEKTLHRLKDITNILKNCKALEPLEETSLFEIKFQGIQLSELYKELELLPSELCQYRIPNLDRIIDILDPKGDRIPTFYIYENYSNGLASVRVKKKEIERELYKAQEFEDIERLKSERLELVVLEEKFEDEVKRELVKNLSQHMDDFLHSIEKIAAFDFTLSKVKFAISSGGVRPIISQKLEIKATGLINLQLKKLLESKGKRFTPVNLELGRGTTLITGANMGGKSIALKTVTENLYLFHLGYFPLAETASFPIVGYIYFISDDMQDISKGLSTFGAEIIKLREVEQFLKMGEGFIVFDEFARGTNPKEGYRFVKVLAQFLNKKNSISMLTTHFDGIATNDMNHYEVVGLKNIDFQKLKATMELNHHSMSILQEHMDYRLERSKAYEVPKDAFNIATLLGLDCELYEMLAKEYEEDK